MYNEVLTHKYGFINNNDIEMIIIIVTVNPCKVTVSRIIFFVEKDF